MEIDFNVVLPADAPWKDEKDRVFLMNNTPMAGETIVVKIIRVDKDNNLDGMVDTVYVEIWTRVVDPTTGETKNINGPLKTFHEASRDLDGAEDAGDVIPPWISLLVDEGIQRQLRRYQIQKSMDLI